MHDVSQTDGTNITTIESVTSGNTVGNVFEENINTFTTKSNEILNEFTVICENLARETEMSKKYIASTKRRMENDAYDKILQYNKIIFIGLKKHIRQLGREAFQSTACQMEKIEP